MAKGDKYTEKALETAFREVVQLTAVAAGEDRSEANWRDPIRAWVDEDKLPVVKEAIWYYTATEPRVLKRYGAKALVVADGYRNGPAGDH